ncbi:hypothetical protein RT723_09770 [Psychrosphaera aquimarina]|uniref:Uncharacterized protein n=1 Tax=Psychrosphaera aquimarina TaxID=2044854 RepID=A0ABU3R0R6_9GAMM|nr:hypothetical protein [Psychrosphaera aquimarina]MDU0113276.1 hypothetical protein [Psychrosphaera aquimarina]
MPDNENTFGLFSEDFSIQNMKEFIRTYELPDEESDVIRRKINTQRTEGLDVKKVYSNMLRRLL